MRSIQRCFLEVLVPIFPKIDFPRISPSNSLFRVLARVVLIHRFGVMCTSLGRRARLLIGSFFDVPLIFAAHHDGTRSRADLHRPQRRWRRRRRTRKSAGTHPRPLPVPVDAAPGGPPAAVRLPRSGRSRGRPRRPAAPSRAGRTVRPAVGGVRGRVSLVARKNVVLD